MQLETVVGDDLAKYIPDLARLRMTVFREYPYLYDGSEAYEAEHLRAYTSSGEAIAVLARDGDAIVGASTGIPLAAESEAFVRPFKALGLDPATVFYCGESVLLPAWRGRGIYRGFFEAREAYARELGGMS
jgi:GNAT superfamily N-acetyltransferase